MFIGRIYSAVQNLGFKTRMYKKKDKKKIPAKKIMIVIMHMFYKEHKLSLIITLVVFITIIYVKKIDFDCRLLRNAIITTRKKDIIKKQALQLLYLEITGSFLQELKQYIFADVFGKQIRLVSMRVYKYLLSEGSQDNNDGIIQSDINIGNSGVAKLLSTVILNILPCVIAAFFLLKKFNIEFEFLFMTVILGSYFLCGYIHYRIIDLKLEHREKLNHLIGFENRAIHNTIANYENIKTCNMEENEIHNYEKIVKEHERNIIKYKRYGNILTFFHRAIFSVLKYITYLWFVGSEDVEVFRKISILKTLIETSESNATVWGKIYMKYQNHVVCSSLVYPYIKNELPKHNKFVITERKLNFEFSSYRFEHNGRMIISNLNLTIPYGTKIAITGNNGCGKSSLIKSILGLNRYNGKILVNEHDHRYIDIASIRDKIGYVSQEIRLFNDTVLHNVLYGSHNKGISDVEKLAKEISLHDNINRLKDAYYTSIGENIDSLSGGEKQKIMIARALIKDPAILIFDEPFANLDVESHEIIFEYIFREMHDKTVIMILHDSKYLSRFDKIIKIN